MPPDLLVGGFGDFLQGFLDLVFAEVALARRPRRPHAVGVEGLGNGYEEDVRRVPADPARGLVDPGPDGPEVGGNGGIHRQRRIT